tara:strand:+ start:191 stop:655 length:465 start_codon:yes stop_codon:yes gene_type:complete
MKYKSSLIFIFFIFFSGCGFKAIYSEKALNIKINKLEISGDRDASEAIERGFKSHLADKEDANILEIQLNVTNDKTVQSKDGLGNADTYQIKLEVDVNGILNGNNILTIKIIEEMNYNAESSEAQTLVVEKNIINDLAKLIVNETILSLNDEIQ